jgi:hypothetical protein
MADQKNLTPNQKEKLKVLEPALRNAVKLGNYEEAKRFTLEIQKLLRPTGHEIRLMQDKNWLFEAAMESGNIEIAISGFSGVRQKVSSSTRLYLEATAMLAICYLRKRELKKAQPLIDETLKSLKNIKSESQKRKFQRNIVKRFEDEGMLAGLMGTGSDIFNIDEIQEAALALQVKGENELITMLGEVTPPQVVQFLEHISDVSRRQLPYKEILYLPGPRSEKDHHKLGEKVFSSVKLIIWKSLCDPESDVYKSWYSSGVKTILGKRYLTTAVVSALSGFGIGIWGVAVYVTAILLKMGIDVFCDVYQPTSIMNSREK